MTTTLVEFFISCQCYSPARIRNTWCGYPRGNSQKRWWWITGDNEVNRTNDMSCWPCRQFFEQSDGPFGHSLTAWWVARSDDTTINQSAESSRLKFQCFLSCFLGFQKTNDESGLHHSRSTEEKWIITTNRDNCLHVIAGKLMKRAFWSNEGKIRAGQMIWLDKRRNTLLNVDSNLKKAGWANFHENYY